MEYYKILEKLMKDNGWKISSLADYLEISQGAIYYAFKNKKETCCVDTALRIYEKTTIMAQGFPKWIFLICTDKIKPFEGVELAYSEALQKILTLGISENFMRERFNIDTRLRGSKFCRKNTAEKIYDVFGIKIKNN